MVSITALSHVIDNFGVSDAIDEFPCWDASWTLDPHNSVKIRENPENVLIPRPSGN